MFVILLFCIKQYLNFFSIAILFRCRSAFKLLEIDQRTNLIKPGDVVLDCGAAPGSWTQIAVSKSNSNKNNSNLPIGFVVSLDLLQIYPIKVKLFQASSLVFFLSLKSLFFSRVPKYLVIQILLMNNHKKKFENYWTVDR